MTTIYHPTHPHYAVNKEYIEACFADPDNLPVVQFMGKDGQWVTCEMINGRSEKFWEGVTYRIKPRTVTRTVTYPEPLRQAPEIGAVVWCVSSQDYQPAKTNWTAAYWLQTVLKNGMLFATEADAQACYDALFGSEK